MILKERAKALAHVNQAADAVLAAACACAAGLPAGARGAVLWGLGAAAAAATLLLARFEGLYESQRRRRLGAIVAACAPVQLKTAAVVTVVAVCAGVPLWALAGGVYAAAAVLLFAAKTTVLHLALRRLRLLGYDTRRVIVVGTSARAAAYAADVAGHGEWGYRVAGHLDERALLPPGAAPCDAAWRPGAVATDGPVAALADVLRREVVDEVIFVLPGESLPASEPFLRMLEEHGTSYRVVSPLLASPLVFKADPVPSLVFEATRLTPEKLLLKRVFDLVCAAGFAVVIAPALLLTALAVLLVDGRPVFFSQERVGMNGRRFCLYKFRTMVRGAPALKAALESRNETRGPIFKIRRDPRVTALGALLRFFSLDELPQLVNVLRGDMSLVGPRPALPAEVDQYRLWQRRRLSVPPGLTCSWQVSGRSAIPFERWVELDLAYIDRWSFLGDVLLLARTLPAVLTARGAH